MDHTQPRSELIDGPTLADRIALGPIPLDEALTIARQIAEAVEAAHDKGIIHGDLKPANIRIARTGVVEVLDFGLGKVGDGRGPTVLGTPLYMSPEQARGQSLDK